MGLSDATVGTATVGTATVLFTDLAGSTELRGRLGEDAAENLRARHDALVVGAIEVNRGRVVKSLGDGVMATFTAAADAVAAGVAVQQAIHRHNRSIAAERLAVRVGISVGDVTFEGGDCFGLPVVEAQRLEAAAQPGTVVCADVVALLAKGRGGHRFRSLGALELKGLSQPVAASEVAWEPAPDLDGGGAGLPAVLANAVGMPFAGRAEPLAALHEAWKDAVAGGFRVVLLSGEPGIGKTRLAAEIAGTALAEGALVTAGRCDEDVPVPFQPFATALRSFLDGRPPDEVADGLGPQPGDLARLVPDLAERVPGVGEPLSADPDGERFRLFEAVADWMGAAAGQSASLVVLDDLHWADAGSLRMLRHLIDRAPAGVLVVGTYRDTDVSRGHPLASVLADLRRLPSVLRVPVAGLDESEVLDLVERVGGNDLDEAGESFARLVTEESAGNPFFVGELLRHLVESGVLVQREGRWTSDLTLDQVGIPEGIREVVGRRLDRLGVDTDQVLRSAAVIGYEFDLDLLAAVTDRTEDEALDALEAAVTAGLVVETGVDRFRFAHALVRQTLHEELSSSRRARQHRRVAEALEARRSDRDGDVLAQLALHWAETVAGGDPSVAVDYAVRAGDHAGERLAYEEAVTWYRRALDLLDGSEVEHEQAGRVLARLAIAQSRSGDFDHPATIRRAARVALDAGDLDSAVEALTLSTRLNVTTGTDPDPEKVELLDRALALVDPDDVVTRARLLGGLGLELIFTGDTVRRPTVVAQLHTLLQTFPDPVQRAFVATSLGAHQLGYDFDSASSHDLTTWMAEGLALVTAPFDVARLVFSLWFQHTGHGDRAGSDAAVERYRRLAVSAGPLLMHQQLLEHMTALLDGRLADAAAASEQQWALGVRMSSPDAATYQAVQNFAILREQGRLGDMVDLFVGWMGDGPRSSAVGALTAYASLEAGRATHAEALLAELDPLRIPADGGFPVAFSLWAEVAARLGPTELAGQLLALVAPLEGHHFVTGALYSGSVSRVVALLDDRLARHAEADAAFAAAVDDHTRMLSPPWIARTHLDWAEALVARGDHRAAGTHLDAAEAALADLDLPGSRGRLAALRDAG